MVYRNDIKAVVSYFDPQNIPAISLQLDFEIGDHVKSNGLYLIVKKCHKGFLTNKKISTKDQHLKKNNARLTFVD